MLSVSGAGESFSLACLGDYPSEFFQALHSVSHSHWTDNYYLFIFFIFFNVCIYYMSIVIVIIFTLSY